MQTPSDGKLLIRPDAYFILQHTGRPAGRNIEHFFLEADTGTMSHTKIALKIKAYASYHHQQCHVAKLGMNYFQVAIITSSAPGQRISKRSSTAGCPPRNSERTLEDVTLEALLASLKNFAA